MNKQFIFLLLITCLYAPHTLSMKKIKTIQNFAKVHNNPNGFAKFYSYKSELDPVSTDLESYTPNETELETLHKMLSAQHRFEMQKESQYFKKQIEEYKSQDSSKALKILWDYIRGNRKLRKRILCNSNVDEILENPELLKYAITNDFLKDNKIEVEIQAFDGKLIKIGKGLLKGFLLSFISIWGGAAILDTLSPGEANPSAMGFYVMGAIIAVTIIQAATLVGGAKGLYDGIYEKGDTISKEEFGILTYATMKNNEAAIDIILNNNPEKIEEKTSLGNTAIMLAILNKNANLLEKLISYKAKHDEQTISGNGIACVATSNNDYGSMITLNSLSTDLDIKNVEFQVPAEISSEVEIVEIKENKTK